MDEMIEQCLAMMEAMTNGDAMGSMSGMMPMGGGMGVGMLMTLGWIAGLVAIGIVIVRLLVPNRPRAAEVEARQTLDARYARGELDRESYLRIRDDLTGTPGSAG
jgi:putative membrane protein